MKISTLKHIVKYTIGWEYDDSSSENKIDFWGNSWSVEYFYIDGYVVYHQMGQNHYTRETCVEEQDVLEIINSLNWVGDNDYFRLTVPRKPLR